MERLIAYMDLKGHTQRSLAAKLGISQPAVAHWFRRGKVPAEKVLAVSDITGIKPHELRPDLYRAPKRRARAQ